MSDGAIGLKPGDIVQDTYEITELLGEGGMGATFRGRNRATGHDVAIKVIRPDFARSDKAVELFKRESTLLRAVRSDAVAGYETTLQDREGRLYLVMEFIDGASLASYIRRGARLGSDDVLTLGARLADGLAAIHKLGIVHRDISPDNIIVENGDIERPKFIDFGVASDTIGTDKTIIGDSFAGKVTWAAPEQLGLFDGNISGATDIYALALVLMRVGGVKPPGEGGGMAGAIEARKTDIDLSDSAFSPPLRRVLEAMLRADPADRPADVPALFAEAQSGALDEMTVPPVSRGEAGTGSGRVPVVPIAAGIAALLVIGGAAAFFLMPGGDTVSSGAGSASQSALAADTLATANPLAEAEALIAAGGTDNLNAALGALMALGGDEELGSETRQRAYIRVAEMYDPNTFSTQTSPFSGPNPDAAARFYQRAADLGSAPAAAAAARLGD